MVSFIFPSHSRKRNRERDSVLRRRPGDAPLLRPVVPQVLNRFGEGQSDRRNAAVRSGIRSSLQRGRPGEEGGHRDDGGRFKIEEAQVVRRGGVEPEQQQPRLRPRRPPAPPAAEQPRQLLHRGGVHAAVLAAAAVLAVLPAAAAAASASPAGAVPPLPAALPAE